MTASILWIVTVTAEGAIWTVGHGHYGGAEHWEAPEGGQVLTFLEDPQVSSRTHRYDLASRTFVPLA